MSILSYQVCRRLGLSLAPPSEFEAGRLVTAESSVCVWWRDLSWLRLGLAHGK